MRMLLLAIASALLAAAACHHGPHQDLTAFHSVATGGGCQQAVDCASHLCEHDVCVDHCSDGSTGVTTDDPASDAANGCGFSN